MGWIFVTILAYLILALVFIIDKYIMESRIPSADLYAFYTGVLSVFIFLLAPFVGFFVPVFSDIALAFLVGAVFVFALFLFYRALHLFEASRVVPVVGAISPVFSLLFVFVLTRGEEVFSFSQYLALFALILGSFLITYQKTKKVCFRGFLSSVFAALFFAIFFVLQKNLFETLQDFWNSLIWMSTGSFFMAICFFLYFRDIKNEIFVKRETFRKKTAFIFLLNKSIAGLAGLLQRWAIFLTPTYLAVPFFQGLQGIQYAFLFILVLIFSWKFPKILKEQISRKIIIQKSLAIAVIGIGLAILFNVF